MSFNVNTGLGSIFEFGSNLINKIFPDPAAAAQAQLELAKMQQTGELQKLANETSLQLAQTEVNKAEAENVNIFVSGWRPFIGWVCGSAFAYAYIVQPFLFFLAELAGQKLNPLPDLSLSELSPILIGMLGFGYFRTQEKVAGINKGNH